MTGETNTLTIMEAEKVICMDKGNDALAYAAMANNNRQSDPMATAALMNGGMGGQWNNPFIYLVWMMFAQRMWGDGYGNGSKLQDAEIQSQIQSLRSQMSDNHNSDLLMQAIKGNSDALTTLGSNLNCDFNQLQTAVNSVRSGIDKTKELVRLHRIIENTRARRRLESWSLNVIVVYLLVVLMLVLGSYSFDIISMPPQIMIAILTTTTVNIIGLGLIVLRGHFLANDTEATNQNQK